MQRHGDRASVCVQTQARREKTFTCGEQVANKPSGMQKPELVGWMHQVQAITSCEAVCNFLGFSVTSGCQEDILM